MITKNHEADCVLKADHYGPCSPNERELFVMASDLERRGNGEVLWRVALPPFQSYVEDPSSEYQCDYLPKENRLKQECIKTAFEIGHLPWIRHSSNYTEQLEWPIKVRELTERGDLVLTLPMGEFILKAGRAHKGQTATAVTVAFGGSLVGSGTTATTDNDSTPVSLVGRINPDKYSPSGYSVQPAYINYADGTSSSFLGSDVKHLTKL